MAYLSYNGSDQGDGNRMVMFMAMILLIFIGMSFFGPRQQPTDAQNQEQADNTPNSEQQALPVSVKYELATRTLESNALRVDVTNAGGGRLQSIFINDPDRYAEHGDFIRSQKSTVDSVGGILPLQVTLPAFGIAPETQFEMISNADDHHSVQLSYKDPNGQYQFNKTFTTTDNPYVIHAKFELTNRSGQAVGDNLAVAFFIKQIEEEEPGIFKPGSYVAAKCYADDDMEYIDAPQKDKHEEYQKSLKWFAVDESYFAMAMTANYASACQLSNDDGLLTSSIRIPVALENGKTATYDFDIFLGPKESRYLDSFGEDRNLDAMIDYGWMEVLAKPMAWVLDKFHDFTGNWGLAIIILTLIVRIFLWPVAQKSQVSMMRMSKVAPMMQKLQEQYKDDPQTLAQKQMELYKQYNISPFGCLPLLLQMPIFFALYRCIFVTGGLYHAEFYGWIHDLSARDPYFILPILSVLLLLGQQLLTPTAAKNKQQKIMMYGMPIFFGAMMLFLPSGLCLYMVVSSIFSMAQSFYVRKKIAAEDAMNPIGVDANGTDVIDVENLSAKDKRAAKRREANK